MLCRLQLDSFVAKHIDKVDKVCVVDLQVQKMIRDVTYLGLFIRLPVRIQVCPLDYHQDYSEAF